MINRTWNRIARDLFNCTIITSQANIFQGMFVNCTQSKFHVTLCMCYENTNNVYGLLNCLNYQYYTALEQKPANTSFAFLYTGKFVRSYHRQTKSPLIMKTQSRQNIKRRSGSPFVSPGNIYRALFLYMELRNKMVLMRKR